MTTAAPRLDWSERRLASQPTLSPFIKWPGGKSAELAAIAFAAPPIVDRFIDPFVGGGAVLLAAPLEMAAWANDTSQDLISLYRLAARERPSFRSALDGLGTTWAALSEFRDVYADVSTAFHREKSAPTIFSTVAERVTEAVSVAGPGIPNEFSRRLLRDLPVKLARVRKIELDLGRPVSNVDLLANIEGAIRAAFYMAVRSRYNARRLHGILDDTRSADFFFLREFAYAAMFRFNASDEFNVPYGGMSYNRKSFSDKVRQLFDARMIERLQNTTWRCLDFELFLREAKVGSGDFVFVDPPYDSDFSSYDNLPFGHRDQARLETVLSALPAKVMVVIKDTPLVRSLYGTSRWKLASAAKTYMWTIKSRNDRSASHLTITNY